MVEHLTCNHVVASSTLAPGSNKTPAYVSEISSPLTSAVPSTSRPRTALMKGTSASRDTPTAGGATASTSATTTAANVASNRSGGLRTKREAEAAMSEALARSAPWVVRRTDTPDRPAVSRSLDRHGQVRAGDHRLDELLRSPRPVRPAVSRWEAPQRSLAARHQEVAWRASRRWAQGRYAARRQLSEARPSGAASRPRRRRPMEHHLEQPGVVCSPPEATASRDGSVVTRASSELPPRSGRRSPRPVVDRRSRHRHATR